MNVADSFDDALLQYRGIEVLALPVMTPSLTEIRVCEFATAMQPKQVIQLHDGYAHDYLLAQCYDAYGPYLGKNGIAFERLSSREKASRFPRRPLEAVETTDGK